MSTNPRADQLGLYIHIPFCVRKCPYCDFNTFDVERNAIHSFLAALQTELGIIKAEMHPPPVDTLFIGGGTPTVLSGDQLARVIDWVHDRIGIASGAEITVEANPGSVTVAGIRAMVGAGVNRLSMGVQSFSDAMLQRIGRNHTVRDVLHSYELIRAAGITNVNFDLMFGLPGQIPADWQDTLLQALALEPEHFSCYSLIVEENTPFGALHERGQLELPPDDDEALMYEYTVEACVTAGYEHYEISNFARPGRRCRHNELYWRNKEWLAAGPGAHGSFGGRRYWLERGLAEYGHKVAQGQLPIAGSEQLHMDQQMDETMMLGLRLTQGVDEIAFHERFGCAVTDAYGEVIARLTAWGLIIRQHNHLRLTARGLMLGNRVAAEFLRS